MKLNISSRLNAIRAFMQRFRAMTQERRRARIQGAASFLQQFRQHLSSRATIRRFNLFDLTGVRSDEVKHSSIIAWMLTPHESHGCGSLFLEAFLNAGGIRLPVEDLYGCHVRPEFPGNESIIDILVYKPQSFILCIENKIFAAEGVGQVDREFRDMRRFGSVARVPLPRMFPVFLTPSGRAPTSGDPAPWYRMSYPTLSRHFEALQPQLRGKIVYLVEDLIAQYRRWSSA